jgi:hypothetical protein
LQPSASTGWLRISGRSVAFSNSGFLVVSSSASTGSTIGTFGTTVDSSALRAAGAAGFASAAEDVSSPDFGTVAVSIYLGLWGQNFDFLALRHSRNGRSGIFPLFPLLSQRIAIIRIHKTNRIENFV